MTVFGSAHVLVDALMEIHTKLAGVRWSLDVDAELDERMAQV